MQFTSMACTPACSRSASARANEPGASPGNWAASPATPRTPGRRKLTHTGIPLAATSAMALARAGLGTLVSVSTMTRSGGSMFHNSQQHLLSRQQRIGVVEAERHGTLACTTGVGDALPGHGDGVAG